MANQHNSTRPADVVKRVISYVFLSVLGLTMALPFLWMVSTALKDEGEVFTYPPQWLPRRIYVTIDGKLREAVIATTHPGKTEIRLSAGPNKDTNLVVPNNKLVHGWFQTFYLERHRGSLLSVEDIKDWVGFCAKVCTERTREAPSPGKRLWGLFVPQVREYFRAAAAGSDLRPENKSDVVKAINRLLRRRDLDRGKAFASITVKGETKELLEHDREALSDKDVQRLNRLLLEASYPDEIVKSEDVLVGSSGMPTVRRLACKVVRVAEPDRFTVRVIEEGPLHNQVPEKEFSKSELVRKFAPRWENFSKVLDAIPFGRYYVNTVFVTLVVTLGQVATSALAAFAFARLEFPLRNTLFLGYLATMMIPIWVTMIPIFVLLRCLPDWADFLFSPKNQWWAQDMFLLGRWPVGKPIGVDSYFALIVPGLFSAYGTFLLRQFFLGLPSDLEDAAKIDGCNLFGIFMRVTLPLAKPALATLAIFTFMGTWQSFVWPLIVTNSKELSVLYVGLASFQGLHVTQWTLLMAASLMALLPVIVVFLIGQRYLIEGIQLSPMKG